MSSARQNFSSGHAHGEGEAKAEQCARAVQDRSHSVGESETGPQAQEHRKHGAGFLGQTGEHLKNMAQGAADAVKNAVGAGHNDGHSAGSGAGANPCGKQ